MPQTKRYFDYIKTIEPDKWHKVKEFAPSNPERFISHLEMLPFAGRMVTKDKLQFKIIGVI